MTTLPQNNPAVKPVSPKHCPGYVYIPNRVLLDTTLTGPAFRLYSAMLGIDAHRLSELRGIIGWTERGTRNILTELQGKGLVRRGGNMTAQEAKDFLCTCKKPSSLDLPADIPFRNCAWCTSHTVILHDHHWPVARVDGGTETVAVCAGCHAEYHFLCRETFYAVILDGEGNSQ